jgi:integrase
MAGQSHPPVAAKSRIDTGANSSALELRDVGTGDSHAAQPDGLVTIKGSSKRTSRPRSLPVEEFQKFVDHLENPFRLMALVNVCFGLRISECLGLKWCDVDWMKGRLHVQRSMVRQHLDETKSEYSNRPLPIDSRML